MDTPVARRCVLESRLGHAYLSAILSRSDTRLAE
jgi:hypothetical protein